MSSELKNFAMPGMNLDILIDKHEAEYDAMTAIVKVSEVVRGKSKVSTHRLMRTRT